MPALHTPGCLCRTHTTKLHMLTPSPPPAPHPQPPAVFLARKVKVRRAHAPPVLPRHTCEAAPRPVHLSRLRDPHSTSHRWAQSVLFVVSVSTRLLRGALPLVHRTGTDARGGRGGCGVCLAVSCDRRPEHPEHPRVHVEDGGRHQHDAATVGAATAGTRPRLLCCVMLEV